MTDEQRIEPDLERMIIERGFNTHPDNFHEIGRDEAAAAIINLYRACIDGIVVFNEAPVHARVTTGNQSSPLGKRSIAVERKTLSGGIIIYSLHDLIAGEISGTTLENQGRIYALEEQPSHPLNSLNLQIDYPGTKLTTKISIASTSPHGTIFYAPKANLAQTSELFWNYVARHLGIEITKGHRGKEKIYNFKLEAGVKASLGTKEDYHVVTLHFPNEVDAKVIYDMIKKLEANPWEAKIWQIDEHFAGGYEVRGRLIEAHFIRGRGDLAIRYLEYLK